MEVLYRLKGNETLLLNDPEKIWVVPTGTVAIFATKVKNGLPEGERRYLFSVGAGEALFGAVTEEGEKKGKGAEFYLFGLLAVTIETTELSETSIPKLADSAAAGDREALALLEGWINQLNETVYAEYTTDNEWQYLSPNKPENAAEITTILGDLHKNYFDYLNWLEQKETSAAFLQFQRREKLNRQVVEGALSKLASVVKEEEKADVFQSGTPLLVAVGAVGKAMGINVIPPAQSEDFSRVEDPVEAIARSSQFRTRRTVLESGWWEKGYGALLAYTKEKRPVALLPTGRHYMLFDPVTQTRTPVDKDLATTLAREAYQFYRPLAKKIDYPIELFRFGIKGYEKDIASIVVVGIVGTLLGMVVPQATALLVDHAIPDSDRGLLWQIGLALFAIAFAQSAFQASQGIISVRVESAADTGLQTAMWDRILRLSPAFFRQYSSGDLLNRALGVRQVRQKLSGITLRTLLSGLFSLLNLGLMFVYSWQLALVGMGIALLASIVTIVSGFLVVSKSRRQQELDGEINGLTIQLINGVAKLRVARAEERAFAAWADRYSQRVGLKASLQRIKDRVSVFNEVLPVLNSALLFWFAIVFIEKARTTGDGLTPGTFLAFNAALGIFIGGVISISNTLIDILAIIPLWERAQPIFQAEPEYDPTKTHPGRLTGRVALDRVTFRYRDEGLPILNEVSLHAEPGEFVAIVGPSGSGKSTIVRLLLGFETPRKGGVYYDGFDLADLDLVAVRRQLGVVLQGGRIGTGSIFENITAGALVSHDEAWEAARMAGFAEDVEQMPMKMHTVISEGGSNLSGGQRQRLLIARAMVLKPKILLMDEATSALDNRTQAIVTESLDKLKVTRIVIAHRLSTIRHADKIYVVEAGRVVQVGTFEELVQQEGLFAQLVARQME